jgi:hypothetical protein
MSSSLLGLRWVIGRTERGVVVGRIARWALVHGLRSDAADVASRNHTCEASLVAWRDWVVGW